MHYAGYNALKSAYAAQGFHILGFPCNQFNLQEPADTGEKILNGIKYVQPGGGFVPNFQMFAKVEVNGEDEHPLFTYLKKYCGPTSDTFNDLLFYSPMRISDIRWNFEQFVIDRTGRPRYRYSPDTDPRSLNNTISKLLLEKPYRGLSDNEIH